VGGMHSEKVLVWGEVNLLKDGQKMNRQVVCCKNLPLNSSMLPRLFPDPWPGANSESYLCVCSLLPMPAVPLLPLCV
jgi:hypothetical protein